MLGKRSGDVLHENHQETDGGAGIREKSVFDIAAMLLIFPLKEAYEWEALDALT